MNEDQIATFNTDIKKSYKLHVIPTQDDLSNITKGYDRLARSYDTQKLVNARIEAIIKNETNIIIPYIIFGIGDTGTSIWLNKFKDYHDKTIKKLDKNKLPAVLMIGKDEGSWRHDYTLAQRHSILERGVARENPSAYLSTQTYKNNHHVNGRHIYQANQANLGLTQAPVLKATVLKIETIANHADWPIAEHAYRLIVATQSGIKYIYTDEINICTGLGPARNISGQFMPNSEFISLNQFNGEKRFTPIVDGNQYILTGTEELQAGRKIVVYGGGGTAAACYRKGFFGNDIHTEDRAFTAENQKNEVVWVARQFNKAGTGKLATSALSNAARRGELLQGDLEKLEKIENDKIRATFRSLDSNGPGVTFDMICDQFIYSIGQDDSYMRSICKEVEVDLKFTFDKHGMVLALGSPDHKIIFFGAAAMAARETEYLDLTSKWLTSENIGGDVGPGSMPPTRAQINRYNFLQGIKPTSINANMDSHFLIIKFLQDAGVESSVAKSFVNALLKVRKKGAPSGASYDIINDLLVSYHLNELIAIKGHSHLVKKAEELHRNSYPSHKLLSWLNSKRETEDSDVLVSSISSEASKPESKLEREENQHVYTKFSLEV